jgi:hypothetical protein
MYCYVINEQIIPFLISCPLNVLLRSLISVPSQELSCSTADEQNDTLSHICNHH